MRQNETARYIAIGCIVISALNIFSVFTARTAYINYQSLLVSLLGICASILFFKRHTSYGKLFLVWAIVQIPFVTGYVYAAPAAVEIPVWNVYQLPFLNIQFHLSIATGGGYQYTAGVYFLAILFLAGARHMYLTSLYGLKTSFRALKADSYLNKWLPATGTIERKVDLGDKRTWLLVKLDTGKGEIYGLVSHKDDERIKPGKKKQVLQFLEVPDVNMIRELNSKKDFPNGDWVVIN